MTLRTIIADDEPLVRERLRALLAERDDVTLLGECGDGASALERIRRDKPDLVLLDVQMPELDGFEVLEALTEDERPAIVFVTAYDEYAVRAFEVSAVDYLLKPIEPARFAEALDRVAQRHADPASRPAAELTKLMRELRRLRGHEDRLVVRDGQRIVFLEPDAVDRIEAAGNYVRLHMGSTSLLVRESMRSLEARLDPRRFVRVHRSLVVNIDRIEQAEPYFHGEYVLTLRGGTRVTTSRSYSARVRALFE